MNSIFQQRIVNIENDLKASKIPKSKEWRDSLEASSDENKKNANLRFA